MSQENSILQKSKAIFEKLEKKAKESGILDVELYTSKYAEEEFRVRNHELDTFLFAENIGCGIRIIKDGKVGTSYSEKIDENDAASIDMLFSNACTSMEYATSEIEYNVLASKSDSIDKEVVAATGDAMDISPNKLKEDAFEIEQILYDDDKRIVNVPYSVVARTKSERSIINSRGICVASGRSLVSYYSEIIAEEAGVVKTAGHGFTSRYYNSFCKKSFADRIAEEALSKLDSIPFESGNYATIFQNEAMKTIISAYMSMFSSDSVQKHLSILEGKIGNTIASDSVSLIDMPIIEDGLGNACFDAEGVATKELPLIENGVLKNFYYNTYTSKKGGTTSTGHASRGSYQSNIGVGRHNVMLKEGEKTLRDLISDVHNGIMITDLMGVHAGVNPLSGDFSLQAEGIQIRNGMLCDRLMPFIVSGNILTLLTSIKAVGNDVLHKVSSIYSPSVVVESLSYSSTN